MHEVVAFPATAMSGASPAAAMSGVDASKVVRNVYLFLLLKRLNGITCYIVVSKPHVVRLGKVEPLDAVLA